MNILSGLTNLAVEVLKMVNNKQATKYIDEYVELRRELQKQMDAGDNADDRRIEQILKELKIIEDFALTQLKALVGPGK